MKPNKHLLLACKLLVSGILLTLLYRQTPLAEIGAVFRDCTWSLLAVIFVLLLVNTSLSALKWRILLLSDGIDIPLGKLVVSYLIGGFFNIFLPSNIGGDSYRIVDVMEKSREGVRSAASVFADRLTGFIALVSLSLVASVFVAQRLERPGLILLPLGALALLLLVLFLLWQRTWVRALLRLSRLDRFAAVVRITEKFFVTFARYGADRRVVVRVMAISFLFQFLLIFAVYLMAL
ncbi:MAG: flippase-like domain-containing protein, partial [Desulfobulbaceae bacterium]|nr:flippase-like domain-containing protein [Desulfobulbaceae bacterium]